MLAAACQHLDSLCLFRCYSCSDAGLAELTKQGRHLTNLVLHSCPQVRREWRKRAGLLWFGRCELRCKYAQRMYG